MLPEQHKSLAPPSPACLRFSASPLRFPFFMRPFSSEVLLRHRSLNQLASIFGQLLGESDPGAHWKPGQKSQDMDQVFEPGPGSPSSLWRTQQTHSSCLGGSHLLAQWVAVWCHALAACCSASFAMMLLFSLPPPGALRKTLVLQTKNHLP